MNHLQAFTLHRSRFLVLGVLAAVTGFGAQAYAAPTSFMVGDPGFELAGSNNIYSAGMSIDGGLWNVTQGTVFIESGDQYVYAGNNSLNLTYVNPYVNNTVSQTLATTVGGTYTISFYADSDTPNTFALTANGVAVKGVPLTIAQNGFPGLVTNSSLFVDYTGTFYASTPTTLLSFTSEGNPPIGSTVGSVEIDNVSVAFTPEPGSLVLLATGVAGLGGVVRRRLKK